MTQPRKRLVSVEDTPYYHCIGRCVRRAFLCGQDEFSGKNYEHRRAWIVNRLQYLTQIFAIEVCSYAVMSNHYHVILRLNTSQSAPWSDKEIVERWVALFSGNAYSRAYLSGDVLCDIGRHYIDTKLPIWRERLGDLSWFMRCLNEHIARKANIEDECTGRFWEGRFKSQALLDETALITCMAYVDLNPIRAKMASTPEQSDYTSIQMRIHALLNNELQDDWLLPMACNKESTNRLPIDLQSYLSLVDWTARTVVQSKRGAIPNNLSPILDRLSMNGSDWLLSQQHFGKRVYRVIGSQQKIQALASRIGQSWLCGQGSSQKYGFG